MNFLSSFPESLTTLKTNFAVSEQVSPSPLLPVLTAHRRVDAPQLASHTLGLESALSALYLSAFRISIALDRGERAAGGPFVICKYIL